MTSPVVRLRNVSYGYGDAPAVHADLTIERGEVIALLGANGSGKSTLVKGMLGLLHQRSDVAEWFGKPLRSRRDRWRVGYVPQRELAASPVPATLEEIVRSGRVARIGVFGRYRRPDRQAVSDALEAVGLTERRRTPMRELSGGQQRRGLVARALAGDAEVLVLDEPFAGVDRASQTALKVTFEHLIGRGVTLIVVLHELGQLEGLITRTIHLVAGEVVYDGPPAGRPHELVDGDAVPHCAPVDSGAGLGLLPP